MSTARKFDLTRRLAPAAKALLSVLETDTLPECAFRGLSNALNEIADVVEDDELGLQWATPEQRVAVLPERFPSTETAAPSFDARRCTRYVQAIYAAELDAVLTAPAGERRRQLQRSAYTLARIVAGGALPADHVRESLTTAAADLPPEEASTIIDAAFRKGLANPRILSPEEPHQ